MNKKDIKILVATHKKYKMPNDSIYFPLHVGREGKVDLGYQGDNSGDNISEKNPYYCELTGLYWAWKNLETEYIGLNHYRRYFTIDKSTHLFKRKNKFMYILDSVSIKNLLNKYDIILPKKRNYYIETVWSHYKNAHFINDLKETKDIIASKYPEYLKDFNNVMNGRKLHLYNMFVMKKNNFDDYCNWLFDILFQLEKRIDISNYDNYQRRVFGFISERLFNVWLEHKNLNKIELNVINMEHINWLKKGSQFLKRKVVSKRN